MVRWSHVILGVVVASLGGCRSKQLSKERAMEMLDASLYSLRERPKCSVSIGDKLLHGKFRSVGQEPCLKTLKEHGVLGEYTSEYGAYIVTLASGHDVSCGEKFGREDCRVRFECGEVEASIDSIVSEPPRATVRYTLRRKPDDWVTSAPLQCLFKVDSESAEQRQFEALRSDDGEWTTTK